MQELEARKRGSHQANNDCPLRLIFASIKSLRIGIRLRCDLEKPIESGMAIKSEVFGGCFEEIDVLVEIRIEGLGFAAPQVSWVYWLALKRYKGGSE